MPRTHSSAAARLLPQPVVRGSRPPRRWTPRTLFPALTFVFVLALLLPGAGSRSLDFTLAVLLYVDPLLLRRTSFTVKDLRPASEAFVQVRSLPFALHATPLIERALTNFVPRGSVSVRTT